MYTLIHSGVAYLERKEMEINIWVFKNKRKIKFLNFLKSNIKKESQCVSPLLSGNTQFDAHIIVTFSVSIADGGY
jgi:hypothetical protein